MEERNAIPQRATAPIYVGQTPRDCEAMDKEIREQAESIECYIETLEKEVKRQRWKGLRHVFYTALFAAFLFALLLDNTRITICDREDVICTEWENLDGSAKPYTRG